MERTTWRDLYDPLRDFFHRHTELGLWIALALIAVTIFWLMIYSLPFRRFMAVVIVLAAIVFYGLHYFGYLPGFFIAGR